MARFTEPHLRNHAQNTTNPAISLAVNNVIFHLIGPPAPKTSIMYHMGERTRLYLLTVTGNRQGRVTEPKADHFSDRNLGMNPKSPF